MGRIDRNSESVSQVVTDNVAETIVPLICDDVDSYLMVTVVPGTLPSDGGLQRVDRNSSESLYAVSSDDPDVLVPLLCTEDGYLFVEFV